MRISSLSLLIYFGGFSFVAFLLWAIVLDYAHDGGRHARTITSVLAVIGVVHPAAALAAWHLRRELDGAPGGGAIVIASFAVAIAVIVMTTR